MSKSHFMSILWHIFVYFGIFTCIVRNVHIWVQKDSKKSKLEIKSFLNPSLRGSNQPLYFSILINSVVGWGFFIDSWLRVSPTTMGFSVKISWPGICELLEMYCALSLHITFLHSFFIIKLILCNSMTHIPLSLSSTFLYIS